jgi:hypothetical protein
VHPKGVIIEALEKGQIRLHKVLLMPCLGACCILNFACFEFCLRCFCIVPCRQMACVYKEEMSPFARPHTLSKPFPIPTQELAKNYSWASINWCNDKVRVGDAVAVHKDNTVSKLCRVSKVSRHKKKLDRVYSVLCEDGTTEKVR